MNAQAFSLPQSPAGRHPTIESHLTLREVAQAISMSYDTAPNRRSAGTFPIPVAGNPLLASISDEAKYLYGRQEQGDE